MPMELRLGTFNVWGLPEPFTEDRAARMDAIGDRLMDLDLDVLLIQEAWTEEVRDRLRAGALRAGFEVAEAAEAPGGGLMTLSRIPIRSSRFERFWFRGDPERLTKGEFLGGKGFQTLTFDRGEGIRLAVVNTHLHASYRDERPRLNSAVRVAQLLQLVEAVRRIEGLAIIGGDFNCTPADPEYRIFTRLSGAEEVEGADPGHPTISRANFYKRHRGHPDKRIDYLFVRSGRSDRWAARESGLLFHEPLRLHGRPRSFSDHFGFRSTLRLASPNMPAALPPAADPAADPQTLQLAGRLLDLGLAEADRREQTHLTQAGAWVAAAALAATVRRHPRIDRRRLLRGIVGATATISLVPAVGFTTLARIDSDQKREAFAEARQVLARLQASSARSV